MENVTKTATRCNAHLKMCRIAGIAIDIGEHTDLCESGKRQAKDIINGKNNLPKKNGHRRFISACNNAAIV